MKIRTCSAEMYDSDLDNSKYGTTEGGYFRGQFRVTPKTGFEVSYYGSNFDPHLVQNWFLVRLCVPHCGQYILSAVTP